MQMYQTKTFGKQNKHVVFLLAGWKNKLWMFWLFSKILEKNGFYCMTYAYDKKVLSADADSTVKHILEIKDDILSKIKQFKREGHKSFSVFGTSLGSLIALLVANESPDIEKLVLNTPGIDVAETIWGWDSVVPDFKKELLRRHFTLEKLKKAWELITPTRNLDRLTGKKLLIYLSKKDIFVPYQYERIVNELRKREYDFRVIINHSVGHVLTGLFNLLNSPVYLDFLKK